MLLDVRGDHRRARGKEWLAENGRAQLARLTDDAVVALSHNGSAGDDQRHERWLPSPSPRRGLCAARVSLPPRSVAGH